MIQTLLFSTMLIYSYISIHSSFMVLFNINFRNFTAIHILISCVFKTNCSLALRFFSSSLLLYMCVDRCYMMMDSFILTKGTQEYELWYPKSIRQKTKVFCCLAAGQSISVGRVHIVDRAGQVMGRGEGDSPTLSLEKHETHSWYIIVQFCRDSHIMFFSL